MYIALTTAEEQCTIGSDTRSTSRALEALVQPCARSAWELLVYVRNDSVECMLLAFARLMGFKLARFALRLLLQVLEQRASYSRNHTILQRIPHTMLLLTAQKHRHENQLGT